MQKRQNPFDKKISPVREEPIQEQKQEIEEVFEDYKEPIIEQPVRRQPVYSQSQQYQQYQAPVVNRQQRNYDTVARDKYTSTMEQSLRREIKVACARRGIMFAQFVEEACREKLAREGVK